MISPSHLISQMFISQPNHQQEEWDHTFNNWNPWGPTFWARGGDSPGTRDGGVATWRQSRYDYEPSWVGLEGNRCLIGQNSMCSFDESLGKTLHASDPQFLPGQIGYVHLNWRFAKYLAQTWPGLGVQKVCFCWFQFICMSILYNMLSFIMRQKFL